MLANSLCIIVDSLFKSDDRITRISLSNLIAPNTLCALLDNEL